MPQTTARPLRRVALLVGLLLVAVAIGGAAAAGAGPTGGGTDAGSSQLRQWRYGHVVTLAQIADLNAHGQALFTLDSPELTCRGVTVHVDTQAEADSYDRGYRERGAAVRDRQAAEGAPADTDACRWWTEPVPELGSRG